MSLKTISLLFPLLAAAYVSAHGFLYKVGINGQSYVGNIPLANPAPSIIRQVITPFPNKGASNPALTCGPNSTAGSVIADVNPGDALTFDWRGADLSFWPHNTGPMLTYMASCGSKSCDQFDITQAKWFKISQIGKKNDTAWFLADLMTGGVATGTIPSTLAPGNYLLRHELIALHLATALGGAEFYPACVQLNVGGNQTGGPDPSELVSLPGAYSDNDPGIFDPTVFNDGANYTFPGPPVAAFVDGGAGPTNGTAGTTTTASGMPTGTPITPTGSTPTGTRPAVSSATSTSTASSKSCKIKKRGAQDNGVLVVRPRHISRIMRRLAFGHSLASHR